MTGLRGLGACGTVHDTPLICAWVQFRCCSVHCVPWGPSWPSFMRNYLQVYCCDIAVSCSLFAGQIICLFDGPVAVHAVIGLHEIARLDKGVIMALQQTASQIRLNLTDMFILQYFAIYSVVKIHCLWFFRLSWRGLTIVTPQTVTTQRFSFALSWNATTGWRRVCHFVHCAGVWWGGLTLTDNQPAVVLKVQHIAVTPQERKSGTAKDNREHAVSL